MTEIYAQAATLATDVAGRILKRELTARDQQRLVEESLAEFAKANEGPPTDPKVFEEQQRKLQEELQRRAEEARKKLQNSQPAPGQK